MRRFAPAPDHGAGRVKFDHWRGQSCAIEVGGDHVLPVEQEDMATLADTHAAKPPRDPLLAKGEPRPVQVDLEVRGRLSGARADHRCQESGRQTDEDSQPS